MTLCRTAFPSRFATRLSASRGSPSAGAGPILASIFTSADTSAITSAATSARSKGSARAMPRSLPASVSSASISFSCCRPSRSASSQATRSDATLASGSRSATCSTVRSAASGVRSSWAALATKCRCDSNDASSRENRSFSVWPSQAELVVALPRPQPPAQVGGGNVPRGRDDRLQRPQQAARQQPAEPERHHHRHHQADEQDGQVGQEAPTGIVNGRRPARPDVLGLADRDVRDREHRQRQHEEHSPVQQRQPGPERAGEHHWPPIR